MMGISYQDAKRLGIERYWPTETRAMPEQPPPSQAPNDGMNKLERAFWERLQSFPRIFDGAFIAREPFKLRLAGRTWYTVDFLAHWPGSMINVYETKGWMRDDAAVKIKVAASLYPCFHFWLVTRERQRWLARSVDRNGISKHATTPGWLS